MDKETMKIIVVTAGATLLTIGTLMMGLGFACILSAILV